MKYLGILGIAILLILLLSPGIIYATPVDEVRYTEGDDSYTTIYGTNWEAQIFTATNTFIATHISIRVSRLGYPGNVTVSIRATDGGYITGSDLTYGWYAGNSTTTSSLGSWVTIALVSQITLDPDTSYGLVVRAPDGDADNCLKWRLDSSSPTYTGGYRAYSTNSGTSWDNDTTRDMMFIIWGEPIFEISSAAVIPSVFETGDQYIVLHYSCVISEGYPDKNPANYFDIVLFSGATDIASIPLPAWGYKPAAIYISANTAKSVAWGSASVGLAIVSAQQETTYMLKSSDWKKELFELDTWVRTIAQDIENFYGVDMLTRNIPSTTGFGNQTLPADQDILTPIGGTIFQTGMYGLDELRPHLFYLIAYSPDIPDTTYSHEYASTLDWEAKLGSQVVEDMNTVAGVVNFSGKTLAALMLFMGYLTVVGIGVWRTGSPAVATGGAIPFLAGGMWMGLIALAVGAIIVMLMLFFTVWIIFLRST